MNNKDIDELKKKIERKRNILNQMVVADFESEKLLEFSKELDLLIIEYYLLDGKKASNE